MRDDPFGNERLARWLPVLLRVLVVTVTAYPALRKFLEYSYRVEQFRAYGMPWPELAVPVTGVVELVAIVLKLPAWRVGWARPPSWPAWSSPSSQPARTRRVCWCSSPRRRSSGSAPGRTPTGTRRSPNWSAG